jgi:hypothetical protein
VAAGAAALIVVAAAPGSRDARAIDGLWPLLALALVAHAGLLALELFSRHPVRDVALAARLVTRGAYRVRFWAGVMGAGIAVPLLLLVLAAAWDSVGVSVLAALLALAGLWVWEDVWVRAGQSVPLS